MAKTKAAAATQAAPTDFDLDAFIESRREVTRSIMFKRADDLAQRMLTLQAQAERLEANPDAERGLDEPSAEQVQILLEQVRAEYDERGTPVTIREITEHEAQKITAKVIRERGETKDQPEDPDAPSAGHQAMLEQISLALVDPPLSAAALWKIYTSSVVGEAAIEEMASMVREAREVPTGPFSRSPSAPRKPQGSARN